LILGIQLVGVENCKALILHELAVSPGEIASSLEICILCAEVHTDMNVSASGDYQVISSPGIRTRAKMDWLVGSNFMGISFPW
jgi:hypothetical protein